MSTMTVHDRNRELIRRWRSALYDLDPQSLPGQLKALVATDAPIQLAHPLGTLRGPEALYEQAYAPLLRAMPDLERRDYIVMAGPHQGENWVGCGGYYTGVFEHPWLDIPPTRHIVTLRYCEFFQIEGEQIVAMHGLWDIPEVMIQARAWPMSPSLGREMLAPGPASQDGIITGPYDAVRAAASLQLVDNMLANLGDYARGRIDDLDPGPYWHPKMNWYGPAGIGSNRRISGFRRWHQSPFRRGLHDIATDRGKPYTQCYFADGDYVAYCGFDAMHMNAAGDGWLGITPPDKPMRMTSLDFWRCENGRIRENWVLVDLLSVYEQLGVDVLRRMREYTVDRQVNPPPL
ncbi:MAG: ester cyclase [Pseudomonadota bacterium]